MGRFARSWELVKLCWGVLRDDKELVVFPIVSAIGVLLVTASFAIPGFFTGFWQQVSDDGASVGVYVLAFLFYLVQYIVIIFFNSALVSAALIRLKGGDPTLGDGLRGATAHLPAILGYAAIAATVGLILRVIADRGGVGGAIVAVIGGAAWTIVTFLAVPVLVAEGVGPVAAIKRSGGLLKKTWGEQIIGSSGIGLVFGLLGVAIALVGGAAGAVIIGAGAAWPGIAILAVTVLAVLAVALLSATLHGIYSAALYSYAVGDDTGAFDREILAGAFRPKGSPRNR